MFPTLIDSPATEVDEAADEHLVTLAQSGDSNAFERLAIRHRDATYRLALRIVSRPEDAEDVVQDVWLSIYTHIGRFRAESSFRTWIHRIAYHRSLQLRRFQGRSALDLAESDFDDERSLTLATREKTPEDSAILNEQRARLTAVMARLAGKYRQALGLWVFDAKNIEQMARELKISYGAAKTRLHRARLQFQTAARKPEAVLPGPALEDSSRKARATARRKK